MTRVMTRTLARAVSLAGMAFIVACSGSFAPTTDEILGDWQKQDDKLPPISLTLTRQGEVVRARLRLSGVEAHGTATVDRRTLRVALPGRPELTGEFVSSSELTLRFEAAGRAYLLTKRE